MQLKDEIRSLSSGLLEASSAPKTFVISLWQIGSLGYEGFFVHLFNRAHNFHLRAHNLIGARKMSKTLLYSEFSDQDTTHYASFRLLLSRMTVEGRHTKQNQDLRGGGPTSVLGNPRQSGAYSIWPDKICRKRKAGASGPQPPPHCTASTTAYDGFRAPEMFECGMEQSYPYGLEPESGMFSYFHGRLWSYVRAGHAQDVCARGE